jgi:hypothetical protein
MLRPVLVSGSFAVRCTRSTSRQRSASASPLRQPVSARKRVTPTAAGHTVSPSARRNAAPSAAYSASDNRRSRRPSAGRWTPRTGLSGRMSSRMAYIAPSNPTVRLAVPIPPRTCDTPRNFAVLLRAAVSPSATACMNRSTSLRLTSATSCRPSSGLSFSDPANCQRLQGLPRLHRGHMRH